jgi:hypothetical protein
MFGASEDRLKLLQARPVAGIARFEPFFYFTSGGSLGIREPRTTCTCLTTEDIMSDAKHRSSADCHSRRRFGVARGMWLVASIVIASAGCAEPQEATATRAYIERLGVDTLALEVFTSSAERIEGTVVARSPVTQVAHYSATLGPDGSVSSLVVDFKTPAANPDGPPAWRLQVTLDGADSATLVTMRADRVDTSRVAVPPGTVPTAGRINPPVGLWEHVTRLATAAGSDEYPFGVLLAQGQASPNAVQRVSADTVTTSFFGSPMLARVDAEGEILGITGRETTFKIEIEPLADVKLEDLERLAAEFAARDAAGEGLGVASPEATLQAEGGGAEFTIVYSQPAMRGREIWGGLVGYGTVWRTGANAATHFATSRDLQIGEAVVPAGTYTLWTTFTPESATLIINEQTNIWGTDYDESFDLARVPLEMEMLDEPLERFTIAIQPTTQGGVLQLGWDRTRFSVPLVTQ